MKKITQKGFTLIEILVVIAIIGVLSTIILTSLAASRIKSQDAKRILDKKQVLNALNLYYSSSGTWPPSAGGAWNCLGPTAETCYGGGYAGFDSLVTDLEPYLSPLPTNNADVGTLAYNRPLYASNLAADQVTAGSPAGAYLIWAQKKQISTSACPSPMAPLHPDKYWYCYEFVGSP